MAIGAPGLARGLNALIVGASGQVGSALHRTLPGAVATHHTRPVAGTRALDAADHDAFRRTAEDARADVIFFPAAQPNVEWCEEHPAEAERANLEPLAVAADVATARHALLVAYSSDYVFDGAAGPYRETDAVNPISVYGRIKERVERVTLAVGGLVIRTTGVFGREAGEPRNFVLRLVAALARGDRVTVPNDQWSTPTYADDLAAASVFLAERRETGIWHVAGPDLVSREELARRAARVWGVSAAGIVAVPTNELGQKAARPLRGGLAIDKLRGAGFDPRSLDEALADLRRMTAT